MTITFRLFSKLLLILLLSFQFANAMANTGKAFSITGTAVINESELRSGDTIKEGDIIKTGANSSVKIIMKDRTVLDISENTRFEITKYSYNKEAPAKNKSSFRLLKGAFRYISGLIAKNRPQNVQISAGTATIGIRGSFDSISYDGTKVDVIVSIGTATMTLANNEIITITAGSTGTLNVSTGQSSVTPTTPPDPVTQAVNAMAANPNDSNALNGLSAAEKIVAIAALISNANTFTPKVELAGLIAAMKIVVIDNPELGEALAYVSSALRPDDSQAFINAISPISPTGVQGAGDAGVGGGGGGGGGTAVSN